MANHKTLFVNPSVNSYKKRQKRRERNRVSTIDWTEAKKTIEPAIKQVGLPLEHACPFWATMGKNYIESKFGLQCQVWKGAAGVSWIERPNTTYRADTALWLEAARQVAPQHTYKKDDISYGYYHVWLETKEYIIDLANYAESVPCPNNVLVIRRDEPTVHYYIPECEVRPTFVNGFPVYTIARYTITLMKPSSHSSFPSFSQNPVPKAQSGAVLVHIRRTEVCE